MTFSVLFPGQGSQSIGMLNELSASSSIIQQTFAEASDALGIDLWAITRKGPEEKLNSTEITQPVMLAAGIAVWRAWVDAGGCQPVSMAGHSLGEYTALVASGSLPFSVAVKLVSERARLMQSAVPEGVGAMAAILGMDDATVITVCESAANGQVVEAVNFNSPGQVVIAGEKEAVARAMETAKENGAKRVLELPVSVPSHCSLMKNAANELTSVLADIEFSAPAVPVYHNVDAQLRSSAAEIREALSMQLFQPVQWVNTIRQMLTDAKLSSTSIAIEMGPGKVLTGLNRRIDRSFESICIFDSVTLETALEKLMDTSEE